MNILIGIFLSIRHLYRNSTAIIMAEILFVRPDLIIFITRSRDISE